MSANPTRTVACPACEESVVVSVPRSAGELTVTAEPDPDLDDGVENGPRARCITATCPAGHVVHVYFDW